MNILLINDYLEGGGAEAVFRQQAEILKKDYAVEMFYAFQRFSDVKFSPCGYVYSVRFKKKLADVLSGSSFDFIIVHNFSGALSPSILDALREYKKKQGCKIIYYAHDFHLICPNRGYSYFVNHRTLNFQKPPGFWSFIFKRLDYRGAAYSVLKKAQWIGAYTIGKKQKVFDLILTPSDFMAHQIGLLYPYMETKRLYNPCIALKIPMEKKAKEKGRRLKLVYFGRLVQEKGLIDFIEAIRNVRMDFSFTLIGEGAERDTIQQLVTQYGLQEKICIKPAKSQADLFAELPDYDVYVLPSIWYENAPLSVVEAASVGLGLLLSNHGGVLEMGEICNAVHFFNPFDPVDIVEKLESLYKDFLENALPEPDKKQLQTLFSEETYLKNLKDILKP
jgi:glycosyltransferase involved in cell wall biosynthesis